MMEILNKIDKKYYAMINDILKFSAILITINILMFLNNPGTNRLFGSKYVQLSIMVILGVVTYWLIIKELIQFDN